MAESRHTRDPVSLRGPRVADFSTHLSGPIASRQMVQMGADVIKIENPKWGDGNRDFRPTSTARACTTCR